MRRLKCTTNVQIVIRVTKNLYSFCFLHHSYNWNQCHNSITSISIITQSNLLSSHFLPHVTSAHLYQLLQGIAKTVQLSYNINFDQASTSSVTEFKSPKHGEIKDRQWPHLDLWKLTDCLIRIQRKKTKIKAALESPPLLSPSHIFRTNGTLAMLWHLCMFYLTPHPAPAMLRTVL